MIRIRTRVTLIFLLALASNNIAMGQSKVGAEHRTASEVLDVWVANTETHLLPLAEAMPEDKYSFAPTNGEFKGTRTFAQQIKHLAANNYRTAALILGEKPTVDQERETGPESVRTKTEVLDYLERSFESLHKAVASIGDSNLVEPLKGASEARIKLALETRLGLAIDGMCHSFNHYGQLVEYLRMNGIVPPDSQ